MLLNQYYELDPRACALLETFYRQLRSTAGSVVLQWEKHTDVHGWFPPELTIHLAEFATRFSQMFGSEHPHFAEYKWEWGCRIYFPEDEVLNSVVILLPFLTDNVSPMPTIFVEKDRGSKYANEIATGLISVLNQHMAHQMHKTLGAP